jgi:glutathione S-transferase
LFFTTGSPFARAVRTVLVEKGLSFERDETYTTPSVEERAKVAPTLQVPTLIDGDLTPTPIPQGSACSPIVSMYCMSRLV